MCYDFISIAPFETKYHRNYTLSQAINTNAVSQIANFCTTHLIFWVQKCVKCVYAEKYVKMQCTTCILKTVQKLSVERWTRHTLNKRHIGDVAEVTSQTSQLSKWWQDITAEDFLAPPTWRVNVAALHWCELYMFLHWAPLCILLSDSRR